MNVRTPLSRRRFFGGVAATVGAMTLTRSSNLLAQAPGAQATATTQRFGGSDADYDKMVKLASNENNYGPPKAVMDAMQGAWKYANRSGYPDGDVVETIATYHDFFMVSLEGRTVQPVIQEFRAKGILVGRPFPPMINHLRVSVGTPDDMEKFLKGFKEIFPKKSATTMALG